MFQGRNYTRDECDLKTQVLIKKIINIVLSNTTFQGKMILSQLQERTG